MNIFGLNISVSRPSAITTNNPSAASRKNGYVPSAEEWLRGEDVPRGGVALSNAYQQVVWVYRAINVLAEQVANIPFRFSIGDAGSDHLITSGALLDFYARPHPQCNRFQYWELRVIWLMLRGECMRVPIFSDNSPHNSHSSHSALRTCTLHGLFCARQTLGVWADDWHERTHHRMRAPVFR